MPVPNSRIALCCLLVFLLPACAPQPGSTGSFDADSVAREWLEAWDAHDIDRILSFYTEDAVYEDVPTVENGWGPPSRGQEELRQALVQMFQEMPDLGLQFVSAFSNGDRMAVEWIMTGTQYLDYTGEFSIRAVSVLDLEGDKIAAASDYYDAYLLLTQLGMVPALDTEQAETGGGPQTR